MTLSLCTFQVFAAGGNAESIDNIDDALHFYVRYWHAVDTDGGTDGAITDRSVLVEGYIVPDGSGTAPYDSGTFKFYINEGTEAEPDYQEYTSSSKYAAYIDSAEDDTVTLKVPVHGTSGEEKYAGVTKTTGHAAIISASEDGITIKYNYNTHLTKIHVFYSATATEEEPTGSEKPGTSNASLTGDVGYAYINGDTVWDGKYYATKADAQTDEATATAAGYTLTKVYTTVQGLHTDKTIVAVGDDGRTFTVSLESWLAGGSSNTSNVGLVLDASGSMAFTSQVLEPIQLTADEISTLGISTTARGEEPLDGWENYILDADIVAQILNERKTDNSSLGASGYTYYVFDNRTSTNEYVPLAYWGGTAKPLSGSTSTPVTPPEPVAKYDFSPEAGAPSVDENILKSTSEYPTGEDATLVTQVTDANSKNTNSFDFTDTTGTYAIEDSGDNSESVIVSMDYGLNIKKSTVGVKLPEMDGNLFTVIFKLTKVGKEDTTFTSSTDQPNEKDIFYMGPASVDTTSTYYRLIRGGQPITSSRDGTRAQRLYHATYTNGSNSTGSNTDNYFNYSQEVETYNIAVVSDGNKYRFYSYGSSEFTKNNNLALATTGSTVVFNGFNYTDNPYNGTDLYIDDVTVFEDALSETQIKDYLNPPSGPAPETVKGDYVAVTGDDRETGTELGTIDNGYLHVDPSSSMVVGTAGWYYVNHTSAFDQYNNPEIGTAKTLWGISLNADPYTNSLTETGAGGKGDATFNPNYTPTENGPVTFYVDTEGYLHCFYSGNRSKSNANNGISYVYEKTDSDYIKAEALKRAVGQFTTQLLQLSPDSQISAVRFSTREGKGQDELVLLDWTNDPEDAAKAVSAEYANESGDISSTTFKASTPDDERLSEDAKSTPVNQYNYGLTGGTYTYTGLEAFKDTLDTRLDESDASQKFLIVFTDGRVEHYDDKGAEQSSLTTHEKSVSQAIKDAGYTVYAVVLTGGGETRTEANEFDDLFDIVGTADKSVDTANADQYIFVASDVDTLITAFSDNILKNITTSLSGYDVRDYIDPRFDLKVKDEVWHLRDGGTVAVGNGAGTDISETGKAVEFGATNKATLYYDSDAAMYYLEWEDVTVPVSLPDAAKAAVWDTKFDIVAKEDFIGGNVLLTNGNGSGQNHVFRALTTVAGEPMTVAATPNYTDKDFPVVTVNVKPLTTRTYNDAATIFKGEVVDNTSLKKVLQNLLEEDKKPDSKLGGYFKYAETQINEMSDDAESLTVNDYAYRNAGDDAHKGDVLGSLTYTLTPGASGSHTITVEFTPNTQADRKTAVNGTGGLAEGNLWDEDYKNIEGDEATAQVETGKFDVDEVSGQIYLKAEIESAGSLKVPNGKYSFKLLKDGVETGKTFEVQVSDGAITGDAHKLFTELEKGTYTLTPDSGVTGASVAVQTDLTDATFSGPENAQKDTYAAPTAGGVQIGTAKGTASYLNARLGYILVTLSATEPTQGDLTITKTNDANAPSTWSFDFTVEKVGGTITGSYGGVTVADGKIKFTLSNTKDSVTIEGLPLGQYTVTEDVSALGGKYQTPDAKTVEITTTKTSESVTINNTLNTGSLTINKNVSGAPAGEKKFTFTVTADDATKAYVAGKTFGNYTFNADGVIENITLTVDNGKTEGTVKIEGLPYGTYTVQETPDADYTTTSAPADGNVTVDNPDSAEITFTNTYKTGSLKIAKTVTDGKALDEEFSITVQPNDTGFVDGVYGGHTFEDKKTTVTVKAGDSVTLSGLPLGSYTVSEDTAGLNGEYTVEITDSGAVEVSEGTEASVTVTNTLNTGALTVTKDVQGDNLPASGTFTFRLEYTGKGTLNGEYGTVGGKALTFTNNVSDDFTVEWNGAKASVEITDLPYGSYTVTETAMPAHFQPETNGLTATVSAAPATVDFVNSFTHPAGALKITKNVVGEIDTTGKTFTFKVEPQDGLEVTDGTYGAATFAGNMGTVTVEMDGADSKSVTLTNLPTGRYKITEDPAKDFTTAYAGGGTDVTLTITEGQAAAPEAVITNTYDTGALKITKTVAAAAGETAPDDEFTVTVEAPKDVKLDTAPDKYGKGVTANSDNTITVTVKHGQSVELTNLPVGEYTVTETDKASYTEDVNSTKTNTAKVTVAKGATAVAVGITNTYTQARGDLKITKVVSGDIKAEGQKFTFKIAALDSDFANGGGVTGATYDAATKTYTAVITYSATGDNSVTVTGLPVGHYKVTEDGTDDYTTAYAPTAANSTGVSVETGKQAEVTVTNTYKTGTLVISKTIQADSGVTKPTGDTFTFTVKADSKLDVAGKSYNYTAGTEKGTVKFGTDGTATVDITGEGTITITGLPVGSYTVSEAKADNYTSDAMTAGVTVTVTDAAAGVTVNIVNKYTQPGGLEITKRVVGSGQDIDGKEFGFTVTFTGWEPKGKVTVGGSQGVEDTVSYNGSTMSFRLKKDEKITIDGVPAGTAYSVKETEANGAEVASTGDLDGVAASGKTADITVTNSYTGSLTIEKKLTGKRAPELTGDKTFTFDLTTADNISANFDTKEGGKVTFTNGIGHVDVTVKSGETSGSVTVNGLPAGTVITVEEDTSKAPDKPDDVFYIDKDGEKTTDAPTVTIANKAQVKVEAENFYAKPGKLTLTKKVFGANFDRDDHTFYFTVTFTDRNGAPITQGITVPAGVKNNGDGTYSFELTKTQGVEEIPTVTFENIPYKAEFVIHETHETHQGDHGFGANFGIDNGAGLDGSFDPDHGENQASGVVGDGDVFSITDTNVSPFGILEVTKETVGQSDVKEFTFKVELFKDDAGTEKYTDYTGSIGGAKFENGVAQFTLTAGQKATGYLPVGIYYTVTELGTYDRTTVDKNGAGAADGTSAHGATADNVTDTVKFTNYFLSDLTVSKDVVGDAGADKDYEITVTFDGADLEKTTITYGANETVTGNTVTVKLNKGDAVTFRGIPDGTKYTVTEAKQNASEARYKVAQGDLTVGETTGEQTLSQDTAVAFTNYYTSDVTVEKVVTGTLPAGVSGFTFTVTLEGEDLEKASVTSKVGNYAAEAFDGTTKEFTVNGTDEKIVISGLPVGTKVTVTEKEETDAAKRPSKVEYTVDGVSHSEKAEFTAAAGGNAVTVTNYYTGTLTVKKTVTGNGGDKEKSFTFTVAKPNGDQVETFTLRHGEEKVLTLEAGKYTVSENADGYTASYSLDGAQAIAGSLVDVELTATGAVTVEFTNDRTVADPDPTPDYTPPTVLNTDDHFGYIIGIPGGEVRPEQTITRAEVATILFRLLTDEAREEYWGEENPFSDVTGKDWFNHAVSTLYNLGIIQGDGQGHFNPNQEITRAEVAAMVTRFFAISDDTEFEGRFKDVANDAWYADFANMADKLGLMEGYEDNFRPGDKLTRAEAMTVFNRLLDRHPHKDYLHKDMIVWPDNMDTTKWYYAQIQEATNSHECEDVTVDGEKYERWTKIVPIEDWKALEGTDD